MPRNSGQHASALMVNKPRYIHIIAMLPIFILDSDEAMMSLIYNSTNRNVVPEHHWLDFMYSRTRSFKFCEFMPDIFKFIQLASTILFTVLMLSLI